VDGNRHLRSREALLGRLFVQRKCAGVVLWHSLPQAVIEGENELGPGFAFIGKGANYRHEIRIVWLGGEGDGRLVRLSAAHVG